MLVALPYFEAYRYRSPNRASRVQVSRVSSTGKRWVCIFPLWKTAHLRKAFEIGHRWRWGRHVCAEGYVVASDNVDGGGEDVYEKNEIISVVTTKKEDVRLVTIIDLFAHRLVTERQTRGRCVEKTGFPGQKEDIYCAPMRFMHWGRNTLEVLCFSPCESPLFFLLLDTRHSGRRGKKNTLCTLRVSGEVARIRRLSLTRILTPANCRKVFGNVWLKRGDVSFCLVWGGEPSVWWSPHRPQREGNYSFVLQKEPVNVKCSSCPTSLGLFFFVFSTVCLSRFSSEPPRENIKSLRCPAFLLNFVMRTDVCFPNRPGKTFHKIPLVAL